MTGRDSSCTGCLVSCWSAPASRASCLGGSPGRRSGRRCNVMAGAPGAASRAPSERDSRRSLTKLGLWRQDQPMMSESEPC